MKVCDILTTLLSVLYAAVTNVKACKEISDTKVMKTLFLNLSNTPQIIYKGSRLLEIQPGIQSLTDNQTVYKKFGVIGQDRNYESRSLIKR